MMQLAGAVVCEICHVCELSMELLEVSRLNFPVEVNRAVIANAAAPLSHQPPNSICAHAVLAMASMFQVDVLDHILKCFLAA
jgi:hypothetical protein